MNDLEPATHSSPSPGIQPRLGNAVLRRADARFLLPASPRRVVALPGAETWADAFQVLDGDAGAGPPDLVVAPAGAAAQAAAMAAPAVVLEGSGGRRQLEAAGYRAHRWVPLPSLDSPRAMVPVGRWDAARYAIGCQADSDLLWKRARNLVAGTLLGAGAPSGARTVTIGQRHPGPPFLLAAARSLGVPAGATASLALGGNDALSRAAFHVFAKGARAPGWVVKFSRLRGYRAAFDADERGLSLVAAAGPTVAAHAPRMLGRLVVDGHHASVETAAAGPTLDRALRSPGHRRAKLALVDRVAGWALALAQRTAAGGETLAGERRRMVEEVLPHWGLGPDLARALGGVPAVLQHNDLGCWNIVAGADFQVLDWESAHPAGLPLWDLLYFLTDALAAVDGVAEAGWEGYVSRLCRGELPSSPLLFGWIRRYVLALGIPPSAVGPLAALCWMHHGISHVARRSKASPGHIDTSPLPRAERVAPLWLADPQLGTTWDRWRS